MPLTISNLVSSAEVLVESYLAFLRDTQGVSEATVVLRHQFIRPFLTQLAQEGKLPDFVHLAPSVIHDYVIKATPPLTRASRKHLVSALRSFFRFAHIRGYVARNLVDAVPIIATRKFRTPDMVA